MILSKSIKAGAVVALGSIASFASAQMPQDMQGFYLLDSGDGAANCYGGMKNPSVIWINERGFVPSAGLSTGEVCLYSKFVTGRDGTFKAYASCQLRLLPDGELKQYDGRVEGSLFSYGGSQALTLDDGRTVTELYARKCDFRTEVEGGIGRTADHFGLSPGEKVAALYGYSERAQYVVPTQTRQCLADAAGSMMARDYPGNVVDAKKRVHKNIQAGSDSFEIDILQIPQDVVCRRLANLWQAAFQDCLPK
jgi:hypothetical protein